MPVLYLDLDGTVVDVWHRYYSVMKSFWERTLPAPCPELEEYRRLKLCFVDDRKLLRHWCRHSLLSEEEQQTLIEGYNYHKRNIMESEEMLKKDTLIGDLRSFISEVKPEYEVHLLSVRNRRTLAMEQLEWLNIAACLDRIAFVQPSRDQNPKLAYIKGSAGKQDIIIGDSETDIECGTQLGLRTFHVSTGLRSYAYATRQGKAIGLGDYPEVLSYL